MSTSDTPDRKASAKALQGFERSPARCANCRYLKPSVPAIRGESFYESPKCKLGDFQVKLYSVCDKWTGLSGETLE